MKNHFMCFFNVSILSIPIYFPWKISHKICARAMDLSQSLKINETRCLLPIQCIAFARRHEILALALKTVLCQHKTKNNNNKSMHFWIGHSDLMNMTLNVTPHEIATQRKLGLRAPNTLQAVCVMAHFAIKRNLGNCVCIENRHVWNAYRRVQIVFYAKFEMPSDI